MTTKPKTPNQKPATLNQREAALKKENLRLQKKIAKLEAQALSHKHWEKINQPIIRAAQKTAAAQEAAEKLAASLDAT